VLADLKPETIYRVLSIVFFAGVAWMMLKYLRKDVNGIGRKVREQKELEDRRFFALAMILMTAVKEEDRRLFARWLMDANRGNDAR
jgi:hypothetical protein